MLSHLRMLAVAAVAAVFLATAGSVARAADAIPDGVRTALEDVLKQKASQLFDEKNAEGVSSKRGSYSRSFRKVDDVTYQVTFHQDTAGKDRIKSERFWLTLKNDGSGKWTIANQELKETYEGLYRTAVGDEEFQHFDKLSLLRNGLKITASNGTLIRDFLGGQTAVLLLAAADLAYEFTPPAEPSFYAPLYQKVLLADYRDDFIFKPDYAVIQCFPPTCAEIESSAFAGLRKIDPSEIGPKLQKVYDDEKRENHDELHKNGFFGFRRLPEPDRKGCTLLIRRDSPKEFWIGVDEDSWEPREVSFFTSERGPVFSWYSEETRKSGVSAHDLERRDDIDARDYDIDRLHGTVELALVDPGTMHADLEYGLNIKRQLQELPFFVARTRGDREGDAENRTPRVFINDLRDGDGNELTWVRLSPVRGLIVFPKPIPAGTKLTLRLNFEAADSIYKLNPSFSYLDRAGWIPFLRWGQMIRDYDLTTRIPDKYTVMGVGRKASETRRDGALVTRWVGDAPINSPTVIFGDYLQDQPEIKATKTDGTEIPVHVYVDKVSTHTVTSASDAASGAAEIRGSQLKALGDQAVNALNLYRQIYHLDYPYSKLDLVNSPFEATAQSPASLIYLSSGAFRGEGTAGVSGGQDAARFVRDVVAHETGHQWWGSRISNANMRNYWFIESLAEYSSALFAENVYSRKKYLDKVKSWRDDLLKFNVFSSVQDARVMWGGDQPLNAYIVNVYSKGPYAFHILRETFGDEKFFAFLGALAQEVSGKEIVTRDIQNVAEKTYGFSMDWFFDQWIRSPGIPEYALFYEVKKTEDGKFLVQGKIRQHVTVWADKRDLPGVYFRGLGRLTFVFNNGKEFTNPKPIKIEGPETSFALKLPEEPVEVFFNKYGELLAHDVLVNRSW